MSCPCENIKREMPKCEGGTPPVLEINSVEAPVLFHTVTIPASIGNETTIPPTPGAYRNARVFYEANNSSYLYDSDGIPQLISDGITKVTSVNGQTGDVVLSAVDLGAQEKLTAGTSITISNRNVISAPPVDTVLDKTSPNPISNSAVATAIDTITTELDRTVVYDLEMDADAESVSFTEDKIDVVTGITSKEVDTIPTASATSAGIINAADFRSITYSQERLDALENGSVAIANLSASPSQTDLTNAWLNATGYDELINRASIFDITNSKVWTYYTNILLWEETPAGAITVNAFTNSTAGTILGSNIDGNVSANVDGTGSVAGWSTLVGLVGTKGEGDMKKSTYDTNNNGIVDNSEKVNNHTVDDNVPANVFSGQATGTVSGTELTISNPVIIDNVELKGNTTQATYTGKNLFDINEQIVAQSYSTYTISDGAITVTQSDASQNNALIGIKIPNSENLLGKTVNISLNAQSYAGATGGRVILWDNTTTAAYLTLNHPDAQGNMSGVVTLPDSLPGSSTFFVVYFYTNRTNAGGSTGAYTIFTDIQIEVGSAKTSYEPYVGGVASPNPNYPQEVNVVTGTQTITIGNDGGITKDYTIDLGSIELCKIGDYQDYIYKSGDDWYVHKETKKLDISALTGWHYNSNTNFRTTTGVSDIKFPSSSDTVGDILCSDYSALSGNAAATSTYDYGIALGGAGYVSIRNKNLTSLPELTTYLANNQIYAYVVLATPTDTKITNNTLIGQLNDSAKAGLYDTTEITVDGSLPAILSVTYFNKNLNGICGAIRKLTANS